MIIIGRYAVPKWEDIPMFLGSASIKLGTADHLMIDGEPTEKNLYRVSLLTGEEPIEGYVKKGDVRILPKDYEPDQQRAGKVQL
ncbi:MAG: hypothetical protein ISS93_01925 [Candidatus Aenigmarchaeota archaeon]|nr:hypothetical protein [Candidatus Aenigmarchaeota archaeon]